MASINEVHLLHAVTKAFNYEITAPAFPARSAGKED